MEVGLRVISQRRANVSDCPSSVKHRICSIKKERKQTIKTWRRKMPIFTVSTLSLKGARRLKSVRTKS